MLISDVSTTVADAGDRDWIFVRVRTDEPGRRLTTLAEPSFVSVAPHNPNGPIGTMVSIHLALALRNFLILEQVRDDVPWRSDVVDGPLDVHDGYVQPPTRPGIGLELVEKVAAAHPGRSPPPHLVAAPDGSLLDW